MKTIRNTLLLICLLPSANCVFAQYDPSKIDKKAVALYNQAIQRAEDGNLVNAAGLLVQAIETDKNYLEACLALANIYGKMKSYKSSVNYYEKAFAIPKGFYQDNINTWINIGKCTGSFFFS